MTRDNCRVIQRRMILDESLCRLYTLSNCMRKARRFPISPTAPIGQTVGPYQWGVGCHEGRIAR